MQGHTQLHALRCECTHHSWQALPKCMLRTGGWVQEATPGIRDRQGRRNSHSRVRLKIMANSCWQNQPPPN